MTKLKDLLVKLRQNLYENYIITLLSVGLPLIAFIYIDIKLAISVFIGVQIVIGIFAIRNK